MITAAALGVLFARLSSSRMEPPAPAPVARLEVRRPAGQLLVISPTDDDIALSPDATRVAYLAQDGPARKIWLYSLERGTALPVEGSEGARNPFFSPDGRWVAFVKINGGALVRSSVEGGPPVPIRPTGFGGSRGASWSDAGFIVIAGASSLQRVDVASGAVSMIANPERSAGETRMGWPDVLPGGRSVLVTVEVNASTQVAILDLESKAKKTLIRNATRARYLPPG